MLVVTTSSMTMSASTRPRVQPGRPQRSRLDHALGGAEAQGQVTAMSAPGLGSCQRTATRETLGKASLSSASRFPLSSSTLKLKPVMLPPGLERLRTRPLFTGSAMRVMTIGIVALAFLAACTDGVFAATITSTLSSTK